MSVQMTSKISLALGGSKKADKGSQINVLKRPHASLQDQEEDDTEHGKVHTVSHFDKSAGGAFDESKPRKDDRPLVIAPQANRDWREASNRNKRHKSGKADDAPAEVHRVEDQHKAKVVPIYGLNVRRRNSNDDLRVDGQETAHGEETKPIVLKEGGEGVPSISKTEDELAVDALLGKGEKKDLVLPAVTEEEAFERDFRDAPDMATLDDYTRVPVEQFGAALLRGMGWKEGEGIGSNRGKKIEKTKIPERRPALLGIGAKEEAAVAQELGTWGKAAKDRKGPQQVYNPVLLRDKKTGELYTEAELEKKKERAEREKYELEFEREERRKEDERRRAHGRPDRKADKKDDRRERDRDVKERRRRDDSDEEYYRRKREKRRREREKDVSDDDRYRSKRDGHRHDRHQGRDRHHDHDRRR